MSVHLQLSVLRGQRETPNNEQAHFMKKEFFCEVIFSNLWVYGTWEVVGARNLLQGEGMSSNFLHSNNCDSQMHQ